MEKAHGASSAGRLADLRIRRQAVTQRRISSSSAPHPRTMACTYGSFNSGGRRGSSASRS